MTGKYLLLALLATAAFAQDPVSITPYQLLDARSGQAVACSGCSIYTYAAGTNTPLATYTSSTLATPNTNPVLTNSAGYAVNGATITGIWVGSSCYKFVAKDSSAVTLFTQDNICDRSAVLKAQLAASSGSALIGFKQAESGAVARTVQGKLRDIVSVKDFGATGDGVTNDTAALNLAIASCATSGGPNRQIVFPNGNYLIKGRLLIASRGCWLKGENQAGANIVVSPTSANTDGVAFISPSGYQSENKISDITIQADNTNVRRLLVIDGQDRFWGQNVHLSSTAQAVNGVYIDGVSNVTLDRFRSTGMTGDCLLWGTSATSTSTKITNGYFGSCAGSGGTVNAFGGVTFAGNTFESNGGYGLDIGPTSVARVTARDNHFEANALNQYRVGIAGSGSTSISELDLEFNETLQIADASPTKVLIQADHAKIRVCNRYTFNPNVFTDGWVGGTANTTVESACDPTAGYALNAFPFLNGSVNFFGWGPMDSMSVASLAVGASNQTSLTLTPDFKNAPTGLFTVDAFASPLIVSAPAYQVSPLASQAFTLRVHNSAATYMVVQFNAAYLLSTGAASAIIEPSQNMVFNFAYDPFDSKWVQLSGSLPTVQAVHFAALPACGSAYGTIDGLVHWIDNSSTAVWGDPADGAGALVVGTVCRPDGTYRVTAK